MSITINNNSIIQSNQNYNKRITNKYVNNSTIQNKKIVNKAGNKVNQIKTTRPHELASFLDKSELRVLNEVFGESNRNNKLPKFNTSNNVSLLKGSKIDIEL